MALPATDAFTNSNGTALETHGNWAMQGSGGNAVSWAINTNSAHSDDTNAGCAYYTGETWDDAQYSQVVLAAMTTSGSGRLGPACRCFEGTAKTAYRFWVRDFGATTRALGKIVSETDTDLDTDGVSPSVPDVLRIEADGTAIRALVDASEVLSTTDATITSGAGGMYSNNNSLTSKRLDDFEADNLAGALTASGTPLITEITASGVASFLSAVTVTDVNTTEAWDDGDTGLVITGTGFL